MKGVSRAAYSTLAVELLVTALVARTPLGASMSRNPGPVAFGLLASVLVLAFAPLSPIVKLAVFTLASTLAAGAVRKIEDGSSIDVRSALFGAVAIFAVMAAGGSALADAGHDLGAAVPYLFAALLGVIVAGVVTTLSPSRGAAHTAATYLGLVLFALYVMVDANALQNGAYSDFVDAAVSFYLDFANVFWNLVDLER